MRSMHMRRSFARSDFWSPLQALVLPFWESQKGVREEAKFNICEMIAHIIAQKPFIAQKCEKTARSLKVENHGMGPAGLCFRGRLGEDLPTASGTSGASATGPKGRPEDCISSQQSVGSAKE